MVTYVGPATGLEEDPGRRLALHVRVLGADPASRPEQPRGGRLEHPHRVEPVVPRPQRQSRVVVAGLGGDALERLEGDVRRVARHHVDRAVEVGERVGHVTEPEVDRRGGEVALGPLEGRRVQLDRVHAGGGDLVGDARRDRPRAGAEVHDDGVLPRLAGPVDRPAGEELGLGARHEDAGADLELDVPEARAARQVLQRLARGPPGHELLEARRPARRSGRGRG